MNDSNHVLPAIDFDLIDLENFISGQESCRLQDREHLRQIPVEQGGYRKPYTRKDFVALRRFVGARNML